MSQSPGRLPTFLIIGTQKSATRWLRYNLGRHPDVFTPKVSEVSFFDVNYDKGLDWYRSHFADAGDAKAVGESTPGYTMWTRRPRRCAKRIAADLPDARLLAILRNPVDRCYSAFIHHQAMGRIPPKPTCSSTFGPRISRRTGSAWFPVAGTRGRWRRTSSTSAPSSCWSCSTTTSGPTSV